MTVFEFVLMPFAIILGFGVSEILASWGQQIRARHHRSVDVLQIAASTAILFFCMIYLWSLWLVRDLVWTFPIYILVAVPGFAVALAAHVSKVDTSSDAPPTREQYFQNSRPLFSILCLLPSSVILLSVLSDVREQIPDPPNFVAVTATRLAILGMFVFLAYSRNPRHHMAAIAVWWLTMVGLIVRLSFRLSETAA